MILYSIEFRTLDLVNLFVVQLCHFNYNAAITNSCLGHEILDFSLQRTDLLSTLSDIKF